MKLWSDFYKNQTPKKFPANGNTHSKIQCSVIIFDCEGWKNATILQLIHANPLSCEALGKTLCSLSAHLELLLLLLYNQIA